MRATVGLWAGLMIVLGPAAGWAGDWPAWRGPLQTGVSADRGLPTSTKELAWKIPYGGRSTPAIVGGRVFGINLAGEGITEQERIFAADLATGKILWEYKFNVFHTDVPNTRVGWSNVAVDPETGNVYAQGVQGLLLCLSRDGKLIWSKSLTELYGRISGYGGRTHTPVIDEERVIISFNGSSFGSHAVGTHRYLALDKRTGEVLWWSAPGGRPLDTNYSTPAVAVINGQRLLIGGSADGSIYAIKSRTGEKVWGYHFSHGGINTSPVIDGYKIYATHSDESEDTVTMGRVVCIDGRGTGELTKANEIWRQDGVDAGYASPLLHGGRLYVMSNSGVLHCFDAGSGKNIWEFQAGRIGKGSPVWADGKIYLTTGNGTFQILQDEGESCRRLAGQKFEMGRIGAVELFGSAAVGDSRVVFFTTTDLVCLAGPQPEPQSTAAMTLPAEAPADVTPAVLLTRPAEVLLKPGEKVAFQALAYNAHGQFIKAVPATWAVSSPAGTVDAGGAFQAGGKPGIAEVTAALDKLTATARVRIAPQLPLSETFEAFSAEKMPGAWIGVSKVKYTIQERDGGKVLVKLSDDKGPIFNRSHVFITPPLPTGYTVQADVLGLPDGKKRGDVGLVNARYVLELIGGVQRLRVMSWVPGPRFEKKMDFAWEPDRWYRAKLKVELVGGEAKVYAKVWPRDAAEPAAWTLEATDPQPNLEGAAGLYANSTMAPVAFDNVKIELNGSEK